MKSLAFLLLGAAISGLFLANFDTHQLTHVIDACPQMGQEKAVCEERQERSDRHRQAVAREEAEKFAEQQSLGVAENLKRFVVNLPARKEANPFGEWGELQLKAGQVMIVRVTGGEKGRSYRVLLRPQPGCKFWINNEEKLCWPTGQHDTDGEFEIKGQGTVLLQAAVR